MSLVIRSVPVEASEPPTLPTGDPTFAWMGGDFSLWGYGLAWRYDPGPGEGRFLRARDAWRKWLSQTVVDDQVGQIGAGPVGFGTFTFDPNSPGSAVGVPQILVGRRGSRSWVTTVGDAAPFGIEAPNGGFESPDRPRYVGPTRPDWEWMESVARAVDLIKSGELVKVVLARDVEVWSRSPFQGGRLLRRLRQANPGCYTFLVEQMVGATPELLLRCGGAKVESLALAGTAPRHPDPRRDKQLARRLAASPKDLHEHELTADSVETALRPLCSELRRTSRPTIAELANLRHLATSFSGTLDRPLSCFDVLERLHPTAAVGGVPSRKALQIINQLEGIDRAGYAGPVGWFDQTGGGEWAIALRCAQLTDTGARLFAGAGIVSGSLPEEELAETRLKLRAMTEALDLR